MMPKNAAGGAAGGASAWMSGVLKDMQVGITGQEENDNPLGDNEMIDGIGMALEQALLQAAIQGGDDIGLHLGMYIPTPPEGLKGRFFLASPYVDEIVKREGRKDVATLHDVTIFGEREPAGTPT